MILLLIPLLIVLVGASFYALFTSHEWQIILACIVLWAAFNSYFRQGPMQGQTTEDQIAQAVKDVQTHRDQWAAEDALWAKQHR